MYYTEKYYNNNNDTMYSMDMETQYYLYSIDSINEKTLYGIFKEFEYADFIGKKYLKHYKIEDVLVQVNFYGD